jgi:hypothetical protein
MSDIDLYFIYIFRNGRYAGWVNRDFYLASQVSGFFRQICRDRYNRSLCGEPHRRCEPLPPETTLLLPNNCGPYTVYHEQ